MTVGSEQTRRARSEAGRKAAEAKKRKRAFAHFLQTGAPVGPPEYAPGGSAVGASPIDPEFSTIPAILKRLRAHAAAGR